MLVGRPIHDELNLKRVELETDVVDIFVIPESVLEHNLTHGYAVLFPRVCLYFSDKVSDLGYR